MNQNATIADTLPTAETRGGCSLQRVLCGDCVELMSSMPDKSVSCIITDPPFGSATRDWDKEPTAEAWAQMRRVTVLLKYYQPGFPI